MKKILIRAGLLICIISAGIPSLSWFAGTGSSGQAYLLAQDQGETLFKDYCSACHTVNEGKLVGPDLANVHKRHTEEWIVNFVRSSQTMIKSGDADAVALFEEFNKIIMPDPGISDEEIKAIIGYIISQSPEEAPTEAIAKQTGEITDQETDSLTYYLKKVAKEKKEQPAIEITEANILNGQNLFVGINRLKNGGPSCNSCHHIKNDAIIAGGVLAKDLTTAFSRLNEAGVKAILSNTPYLVMKQAYKNNSLTEQEILDISAFLKYADEQHIYQHPRDYGKVMIWGGIPGAISLLGFFYFFWFNRKKRSVNHEIYERQIKSVDI